MKYLFLRLGCLLALAGAAGCDDSPTTTELPDDTGPRVEAPVTFPVLGTGRITDRYSAELSVRDGIAYTTTWGLRGTAQNRGNTVYVWDVAVDQPRLLDSLQVSGATTLGDVQVSDDGRLLVVATELQPGSIVIYDRAANPRKPVEIARFSSPSTQAGVHTAEVARVDGRLLAFLSVNPSQVENTVRGRLVIVDLSDPANPREVTARAMGQPILHDVFVREGLLFTALWDGGMTVWDIGGGSRGGSPANPVELYNVGTVGGNAHNIWWYHDPVTRSRRYALVGEEQVLGGFGRSGGDIHVVDLETRREVAVFTVPGAGTHNFWVDEENGILYAAYYNGGVRALDIRGDLGKCADEQLSSLIGTSGQRLCDLGKMGREVGRGLVEQNTYVWGVQQVGTALYAIDMLNGLWKLDVTPLLRELRR